MAGNTEGNILGCKPVVGSKSDTIGSGGQNGSVITLLKRLLNKSGLGGFSFGFDGGYDVYNEKSLDPINDITASVGSSISGRAITATLYVSPDGDDSDGSSWVNAYTTIQGALDVASTDPNDVTLILIAPHSTYYNINRPGDPTWTGNYELKGTHRKWAVIKNTHASATSIMKFTGKASLQDLAISQQGTVNGVIFTASGWRVRRCGFSSENLTGAATSFCADGSAAQIRGGIMEFCQFQGNVLHTTAAHLASSEVNEIGYLNIHEALVGILIDGSSDDNIIWESDFGDCALAIDINAGSGQHFNNLVMHNNTRNFDDEVGDHSFRGIEAASPITAYPDNFTGVSVLSAVAANTWGALTEIIAADAIDNPFRVVGVVLKPAVSQLSRIRFTGDAGTIYFDDLLFEADRKSGSDAPGGTDFIFNKGTKIEAAAKVVGGGPDNIVTWLKIQTI